MAAKAQHGKRRTERRGGAGDVSEVRLIAGLFRGRKLQFAAAEGLRPTLDRIRETLFNWLGSYFGMGGEAGLSGLHCLDLFAGTGALGAEALSRGAAHVILADSSSQVCRQIDSALRQLTADEANAGGFDVRCADALAVIKSLDAQAASSPARLDLVFLDPPFARQLLQPCIEALTQSALLKPGSLIYFESEKSLPVEAMLPTGYELFRHKSAGQLQFGLVRCQNSPK